MSAITEARSFGLVLSGTIYVSFTEGNTTQAAVSAAIAANVVLFGYIITALKEDQQEKQQVETRKTQ